MTMIVIKPRELKKLSIALSDFPQIGREELDRWLTRSKTAVQQDWRRRALHRPFPRFSGRYGQSIHPQRNKLSTGGRVRKFGTSVVAGAPHAIVVDEGRKPGKAPPPKAMQNWIKKRAGNNEIELNVEELSAARKRTPRGLKKRTKSERLKVAIAAAGFLTGRKIAKEGTDGRHLAQKTTQKLTVPIHREFERSIDKMIQRFIRGR